MFVLRTEESVHHSILQSTERIVQPSVLKNFRRKNKCSIDSLEEKKKKVQISCHRQSTSKQLKLIHLLAVYSIQISAKSESLHWNGSCSRNIFFSRVNLLCQLLFWYPLHPSATAVACKRSWSFCRKGRWQVTA